MPCPHHQWAHQMSVDTEPLHPSDDVGAPLEINCVVNNLDVFHLRYLLPRIDGRQHDTAERILRQPVIFPLG